MGEQKRKPLTEAQLKGPLSTKIKVQDEAGLWWWTYPSQLRELVHEDGTQVYEPRKSEEE